MKVVILQETLNKALSVANHFVPSRPQLPILTNLSLKTEKNRLLVSATNLEIGLNYYCGAKIEEAGGVAILAKTFSEFISSLPAEKVVLTDKKDSLLISCGNYRASLPTNSVNDFPQIPTQVSQKIIFPFQSFIRALRSTVFATSSDDSRPVLSGVNFKFAGQECLLSATDGYRLSFKRIKLDKEYSKTEFIIPSTVLAELLRNKPEEEQSSLELGLASEEKQAVFFLPNLEFSSRLLEGDFPDINKVIPEDKNTSVFIDREELLAAVRTAAIFARESANTVKLEITKDKMRVLANAPSLGENVSQVEAKIEGGSQMVAFNFHFLIDLLTNLDSDQLVIELQESLKPVVFKNPKDKSFLHIIMPVRIQEE